MHLLCVRTFLLPSSIQVIHTFLCVSPKPVLADLLECSNAAAYMPACGHAAANLKGGDMLRKSRGIHSLLDPSQVPVQQQAPCQCVPQPPPHRPCQ